MLNHHVIDTHITREMYLHKVIMMMPIIPEGHYMSKEIRSQKVTFKNHHGFQCLNYGYLPAFEILEEIFSTDENIII